MSPEVVSLIRDKLKEHNLAEAPIFIQEIEDSILENEIHSKLEDREFLRIKDISIEGESLEIYTYRCEDLLFIDVNGNVCVTYVGSAFVDSFYPEIIKHNFQDYLKNKDSSDKFSNHFNKLSYLNRWIFNIVYNR